MKNKKLVLILSVSFIVIGLAICCITFVCNGYEVPDDEMFGVSFGNPFDDDDDNITRYDDYEKKTIDVNSDYSSIVVNGGPELDVVIKESGKNRVEYYDMKKLTHKVEVKDDTLFVSCIDDRKSNSLNLKNGEKIEIVIYTTKKQFESIEAYSTSGDITVRGLDANDMNLGCTSGDITLENSNSGNLTMENTSGDAIIRNVTCKYASASSISGDIEMEDVVADNVELCSTSGDIEGESVKVADALVGTQCSGDIDIEGISAMNIDLSSTSGDITISIIEGETYVYYVDSLSGSVITPDTDSNSARRCILSSCSGSCVVND